MDQAAHLQELARQCHNKARSTVGFRRTMYLRRARYLEWRATRMQPSEGAPELKAEPASRGPATPSRQRQLTIVVAVLCMCTLGKAHAAGSLSLAERSGFLLGV